jgi:hypothetical protein
MHDDWCYEVLLRIALAYGAAKLGEWIASWHPGVLRLRAASRFAAAMVALAVTAAVCMDRRIDPSDFPYADELPAAIQRLVYAGLYGGWTGVLVYPLTTLACFPWVFIIWPVLQLVVTAALAPFRFTRTIVAQYRQSRSDAEAARRRNQYARQDAERKERDRAEQRRREQARLVCEVEYARFSPTIQGRLPRKELEDFFARYMTDAFSADVVEARAEQLLSLVRLHADQADQTRKPLTIEDLAAWFVAEKAKIAALPLDEKLKNYHLAELNERYSDLTSDLMRKAKP